MATRRQIRANRANAKLCTGPKTEAGKQISSQNAVTHGLLSRAVVLKAESSSRFEEMLASLVTSTILEFKPSTPNDHALVETMAIARWRQTRITTLLTATVEIEMARQDPASGNAPVRAANALRTLIDSSQILTSLQRYQTAESRLYSRALADLLKAQAARSAFGRYLHPNLSRR